MGELEQSGRLRDELVGDRAAGPSLLEGELDQLIDAFGRVGERLDFVNGRPHRGPYGRDSRHGRGALGPRLNRGRSLSAVIALLGLILPVIQGNLHHDAQEYDGPHCHNDGADRQFAILRLLRAPRTGRYSLSRGLPPGRRGFRLLVCGGVGFALGNRGLLLFLFLLLLRSGGPLVFLSALLFATHRFQCLPRCDDRLRRWGFRTRLLGRGLLLLVALHLERLLDQVLEGRPQVPILRVTVLRLEGHHLQNDVVYLRREVVDHF